MYPSWCRKVRLCYSMLQGHLPHCVSLLPPPCPCFCNSCLQLLLACCPVAILPCRCPLLARRWLEVLRCISRWELLQQIASGMPTDAVLFAAGEAVASWLWGREERGGANSPAAGQGAGIDGLSATGSCKLPCCACWSCHRNQAAAWCCSLPQCPAHSPTAHA